MSLALALAAPPNMFDVSRPASYVEARDTLVLAGSVLSKTINEQPSQKSIAQVLTAQTLKDLGTGWQLIFSSTPIDPESSIGGPRFSWEPSKKLVIAFSDSQVSGIECQGIEKLFRAAVWRELMGRMSGDESIDSVEQTMSVRAAEKATNDTYSKIAADIEAVSVEVFGQLFKFERSTSPLFSSLDIRWGRAATCITTMGDEYRAANNY